MLRSAFDHRRTLRLPYSWNNPIFVALEYISFV